MRKTAAIILVALAGMVRMSATDYLTLVDEADKAVAESRWADADSLLVAAMQLEPSNSGNILLLSNLGMMRHYMHRDSAALEILDQACRIAPHSVTILTNRATVLTSMALYDRAVADYDSIIAINSESVAAHFNRGLLLLKLRNPSAAGADFAVIDSLAPGSREAELGMAAWHSALGEFEQAAIRYTHLLEIERQPEYLAARALCYLMTDRLAEASDDIASGLSLDPTDPELYFYRAILNRRRYRPDDARADAQKAVNLGLDPRRAEVILGK